MSKKKQGNVTFHAYRVPDAKDSWTRYYVQVWQQRDMILWPVAGTNEPAWSDQGYGHEDLSDALKQYRKLKEIYVKVQIVERTNTNKVIIP